MFKVSYLHTSRCTSQLSDRERGGMGGDWPEGAIYRGKGSVEGYLCFLKHHSKLFYKTEKVSYTKTLGII